MKIVIVVVGLLLVILGGGVAAMRALEIGPFATGAVDTEAVAEAPRLEPPRFINVEPIVVPVFIGDAVGAQIQVTVKLEAVGAENESKINKLLPRLNDAFYKDLYAFIPRLLREDDRLNVFVLRKRMQLIADKVAGPGIIDGVLIQSVTDSRKKDENQGEAAPAPPG